MLKTSPEGPSSCLTTSFLRHSRSLLCKYRTHWYRIKHFLGDCSVAAEQICAKIWAPSEIQYPLFRKQGVLQGVFFLIKTRTTAKNVSAQCIGDENTVCAFLRKAVTTNDNTALKGLGIANYYQWHKKPKQNRMGDTQIFGVWPCFASQDSSVLWM